MTDAQRRFMHARQRVESMMLNPTKEFLEATVALVEEHKAKAAEAEKLEARNSLLFNMNADGEFGPRIAMTQIWEMLGVDNQTAAMQRLRAMKTALETIASCNVHIVGDVVDIARKALGR